MANKICNKCKYENSEIANFCKSCGIALKNNNDNQTSEEQAKQIVSDSKNSIFIFLNLLKVIFISPLTNLFKLKNTKYSILFKVITILNIGILILISYAFFNGVDNSYFISLIALAITASTFIFSRFHKYFLVISFISSLFALVSFGLAKYSEYIELYDYIKEYGIDYTPIFIFISIPLINIIYIVINRKNYNNE